MLLVDGDCGNLLGSADPSLDAWRGPVACLRVPCPGRESMWQGKRVSVVLMTYNERDSIRATIEGFFATGLVDEVLVVNNNAAAGTSEEVALTRAREVLETRQGYGWASRRGLREARGGLLVLAEP